MNMSSIANDGQLSSNGRSSLARSKAPFSLALRNETILSSISVLLVVFSFVYYNGSYLLQDPDIYWHLKVGHDILLNRELPTVDLYSYTKYGSPWIAKEWLSQVFLALAYDIAGWRGVAAFAATVSALTVSTLFFCISRRLSAIAALTLCCIAFLLISIGLLARPQLFFFLLCCLSVCYLMDCAEHGDAPWLLAPLVALWANLHASFPIVFVMGALFSVYALFLAEPRNRVRFGAKWCAALLAAFAASGLTPYGFEPSFVAFRIFGSGSIDQIGEWRGIALDGQGVTVLAFVGLAAVILAKARANLLRSAPMALCAFLAIRHVRFIPLFGIVGALTLAAALASAFPCFAAGDNPGGRARLVAPLIAALGSAIGLAVALQYAAPPIPSPRITPAEAYDAAKRMGVTGRVLNAYDFGGFLISRGEKTFIDGRSELYFGDLFERYREMNAGESGGKLSSMLDGFEVSWAIVERDSALSRALLGLPAWRLIYQDDIAEAFLKAR
jgi:hypothetical protein